MKNKNEKRHLELSTKFIEMGQALAKEGIKKDDYTIIQSGNIMIFMGGLLFDEKDLFQFAELCSMFSAKKILENIDLTKGDLFSGDKTHQITYDEFIKRLNDLRGGNKSE